MNKYVRMIVNLIIYLGISFLAFELLSLVMAQNDSLESMLNNNPPVVLILIAGCVYLMLILVHKIRQTATKSKPTRFLDTIPLNKLNDKDLRSVLLVSAGCSLFFFGLMGLPFLPEQSISEMIAYVDTFAKADSFLFVLLGVGLVGTLFEELYFRGVIYPELRRALPVSVAFVVHAVIYAYFQPNLTISFTAFFLALIYTYMLTKVGSIWTSIISAIVINVSIVCANEYGLIDQLVTMNTSVYYALVLVGTTCILFGLYRITKHTAYRNSSIGETGQVKTSSKLSAAFIGLGKAAVYIVIYYVILSSVIYVWTQVFTLYEPISAWIADSHNNLWALVLNDLIVIPIYFLIVRRYQSKSLLEVCNFTKISTRVVVQITLLSIFMGLWVTSISRIPYVENTFPQFEALFDSLVGGPLIPFLVFLIIHSFYKEILFRGLIFNALRQGTPLVIAFAIDALVYGMLFFQLDVALTIYGGMGTVIFGLLYVWYKSLWAPIVAQIGLFATYYVTRHGYAAFDIEFNGAFYVIMAVSSALVLILMIRLWNQRPDLSPVDESSKSPVDMSLKVSQ